MNLHLGCGRKLHSGYTNIDINPDVKPDVVHDLSVYPWPFSDSVADVIISSHLIEHIICQGDVVGFNNFFRECWRVLKPCGRLKVIVPDARGPYACADPGHKSFYSKDIFAFISKKTMQANIDFGTSMTLHETDYDFDINAVNVINDEIHLEASAVK